MARLPVLRLGNERILAYLECSPVFVTSQSQSIADIAQRPCAQSTRLSVLCLFFGCRPNKNTPLADLLGGALQTAHQRWLWSLGDLSAQACRILQTHRGRPSRQEFSVSTPTRSRAQHSAKSLAPRKAGNWGQQTGTGNLGQGTGDRELEGGNWGHKTTSRELG